VRLAECAVLAGISFVISLVAPSAVAQTEDQVTSCINDQQHLPLDTQIAACTAIIDSKEVTKQVKAAAFLSRGHAYYEQKDYDRAIADFDQAVQLDPKESMYVYMRGVAYDAKHDYERAIADMSRAIELKLNDADYYWGRARAYAEKQDYAAAIKDCDQIIRLDPNDAKALYLRGVLKIARGDSSGYTDVSRARQIDPNIGK
jgi:tetratricopeptide (TPR) repeat protein